MKIRKSGFYFALAALWLALFSVSKGEVAMWGTAGFISHVRVSWSYFEDGWAGRFYDYSDWEDTIGPGDFLYYPDELTEGGYMSDYGYIWWQGQHTYGAYVLWLEPISSDGGGTGGGGNFTPPTNPSNVVVEADDGSAFLSWTAPPENGFEATVVVWSNDWDFNAAFNDPSRRIETTDRFLTVEGLSNNTPYNFWVLSRRVGGLYNSAPTPITVTPSVPVGYAFPTNDSMTELTPDEALTVEKAIAEAERAMQQKSTQVGWSLRAVLRSLNLSLQVIGNAIAYGDYVHGVARHVGVRVAREAYLKGEITAEQYLQIVDYILSSLNLPPVGMAQGEAEHNVRLAVEAALAQVVLKKAENSSWDRTPTAVNRFGNSPKNPEDPWVKKARPADFQLPESTPTATIVGPGEFPLINGASTVANIYSTNFDGWYWILPAGTVLPPTIGLIADGSDVIPGSTRGPSHHTIYPKVPMSLDEFNSLMRTLAWNKTPGFKP